MRILVVGSGGREHALVWKLAQEAEVHVAPGNPGMAEAERYNVPVSDLEGLVALAKQLEVDFVVVGPENPLVDGLGDRMRAAGIPIYGPGADGAALEASKAFSKEMMLEAGVPTAQSGTFTDAHAAIDFARHMDAKGVRLVVKASGNALGKGVVVAESLEETEDAIRQMMVDRVFGDAGGTVVLEERLIGREFSLLTVCSDQGFFSLPVAQDYKRLQDGDLGPNTGGMGTYSPVSFVTPAIVRETERLVVEPMLRKLKDRGISYRGTLFSGLMLTEGGIKCLEYNVRFGDPETQTVMRRLGSGFASLLRSAAMGEELTPCEILDHAAVTVVMANSEYPNSITRKPIIRIPNDLPEGVVVFHAGTAMLSEGLQATGGRVLGVSAVGSDVASARRSAYDAVSRIEFDGAVFRSDIGQNALRSKN